MNRSLTIQPKGGFFSWRAHPGPETTMAELEAAISMLKLDILRTTDDEILLVQTGQAIRDGVPPPDMEELGTALFGEDHNAILVTETGQHRTLEADGEIDFGSAEEFSLPADLHADGQLDAAIDQEAKDRHFEEDADRETTSTMSGLGIDNIGNK